MRWFVDFGKDPYLVNINQSNLSDPTTELPSLLAVLISANRKPLSGIMTELAVLSLTSHQQGNIDEPYYALWLTVVCRIGLACWWWTLRTWGQSWGRGNKAWHRRSCGSFASPPPPVRAGKESPPPAVNWRDPHRERREARRLCHFPGNCSWCIPASKRLPISNTHCKLTTGLRHPVMSDFNPIERLGVANKEYVAKL